VIAERRGPRNCQSQQDSGENGNASPERGWPSMQLAAPVRSIDEAAASRERTHENGQDEATANGRSKG
jgi:hypothetical protein